MSGYHHNADQLNPAGYPASASPSSQAPVPYPGASTYDIVREADHVVHAPVYQALAPLHAPGAPGVPPADSHSAQAIPPATPFQSVAPAPHEQEGRNTLAAVLTVIVAIIGIWSMLSYVGSMSATLSSTLETNKRIKGQLTEANKGLVQLDSKTKNVARMHKGSTELAGLMGGLDSDMGGMIEGVGSIGEQMQSLGVAINKLDGEIGKVNAINTEMSGTLGTINDGLGQQATKVRAMRKDVDATAIELGGVPPLLRATNERLAHTNKVVCQMGEKGLQNPLKVYISVFGIPNGNAEISATMIPPGAWRC